MCAILARPSQLQGSGTVRGDIWVREGSCWLQSPSPGDCSCGQGNVQTLTSNLTALAHVSTCGCIKSSWLCITISFYKHIFSEAFSPYFSPCHSPNIPAPSGTTSTWAGLTMESHRSQAASSASSLKWTLNRLNILALGPWSSTAGTGELEN